MQIRLVNTDDAGSLLDIYAPYVRESAVTFECGVPDKEEFAERIDRILKEYPYLAAVENGEIVGYAYAGIFRVREAYRHTAEVSIYVDSAHHGRGIGRMLYEHLESILVRQNVNVLYACVSKTERENDEHLTDGSIRFHAKMGYSSVGEHYLCGYKFDQWYSMIWMEKVIAPRKEHPEPFVPFSLLRRG